MAENRKLRIFLRKIKFQIIFFVRLEILPLKNKMYEIMNLRINLNISQLKMKKTNISLKKENMLTKIIVRKG